MNPRLLEVLLCNQRVIAGNTFLFKRKKCQLQVSAVQSVREAEGVVVVTEVNGHLNTLLLLHCNLIWYLFFSITYICIFNRQG